jgi:hypothetical protein
MVGDGESSTELDAYNIRRLPGPFWLINPSQSLLPPHNMSDRGLLFVYGEVGPDVSEDEFNGNLCLFYSQSIP